MILEAFLSVRLSSVFEWCVLSRYEIFFRRTIISALNVFRLFSWLEVGSTVNLCALDLRKAFDKLNHYGLFLKLMDRLIHCGLLSVLEHWLSISATLSTLV